MRVVSKQVVYKNPPKATTAYEYEYYGKPTGVEKVRLRFLDIADDIFDHGSLAFSTDNGKTWRDERPHLGSEKREGGRLRKFECFGFADPVEGALLTLYSEALFRGDNSLEGMSNYYMKYRVSLDGGRTNIVDELMKQPDPPGKPGTYTDKHPIEPVWVGKNAMFTPAIPPIVRTKRGEIVGIFPTTRIGPDGKYFNPGGGFTWCDGQVMIGKWRTDGSHRIDWTPGSSLRLETTHSTRGVDESSIAELPDGRLLIVSRGSNGGTSDPDGKMPAHKWRSISSDGGRTWSPLEPWRYDTGEAFFSPASMGQLIWHSSGKLYWFGNITSTNANANSPRWPLITGEVDQKSLALVKSSIFVVDTKQPGERDDIQFSNFWVHEDRVTREFVLNTPKLIPDGTGHWTADSWLYRVGV